MGNKQLSAEEKERLVIAFLNSSDTQGDFVAYGNSMHTRSRVDGAHGGVVDRLAVSVLLNID